MYLEAEKIDKIIQSGTGNIISESRWQFENLEIKSSGTGGIVMSLEGDVLKVIHKGTGDCHFTGSVKQQDLSISGTGNYDAKDLVSGIVNIETSGTGNVTLQAIENLRINSSGTGNISYKGNPELIIKNHCRLGSIRQIT